MTRTVTRVPGPLKWHGGKHYLAPKIVALMPPHTHYVEPFAGGLSVLLGKDPEGVSEVVNDLDGDLTTFWQVLRGDGTFRAFHRAVEAVPFSEPEWRAAADPGAAADPVVRAVAFFVRCRQSLAGRRDAFAPLSRARTRRGMSEQASAWLTAVDRLPEVHARLRRVVVLNRDAVDVIRELDDENALFYLDPPYLGETRAAGAVYAHEMTDADHARLLDAALRCAGKVMLSGYPSDLYDRRLRGWARHTFSVPNAAAGGKAKRLMTEAVWCNFERNP